MAYDREGGAEARWGRKPNPDYDVTPPATKAELATPESWGVDWDSTDEDYKRYVAWAQANGFNWSYRAYVGDVILHGGGQRDLKNALSGPALELLVTMEYSKFAGQTNEAEGLIELISRSNFREIAGAIQARIMGKLQTIPFEDFKLAWAFARQMVGLQGRLLLEQCFWQMGEPWKSLYTGFKPVSWDSAGSEADGELPPVAKNYKRTEARRV